MKIELKDVDINYAEFVNYAQIYLKSFWLTLGLIDAILDVTSLKNMKTIFIKGDSVDETTVLLGKATQGITKVSCIRLMGDPTYYLDDMEGRAYQIDRRMSGCYPLICTIPLDFSVSGRYYVDGVLKGSPIISEGFMGNNIVGIFLRSSILEYDKDYQIWLEGLRTADGAEVEPFEMIIHSLPKGQPGKVFPEHDQLVLEAAREGAVLLKNDNNAMPLGNGAKLNLFGSGAVSYRLGCVGAGKINPRYGIRLVEGIEEYSSLKLNKLLFEYYRDEIECLPEEPMMQVALAWSNTAVYVIGRPTGEGEDNPLKSGYYYLSQQEKDMLQGLRQRFDKLIVVLNTGYPIEMGWASQADAILWTGLNGMAGGRALAELLEGTVNPSGRLPDTWTYDYYDIPSARNYCLPPEGFRPTFGPGAGGKKTFHVTVYEEGLYVGYRYFSTFHKPVAFPFGHGLSYTEFSRECTRYVVNGANVELDVCVKNTGSRAGKESILLFASVPEGVLEQPARRLVDFGKTRELAPGESQTLTFKADARHFDSYDEANARWIIEPGIIRLYLGGSVLEAEEVGSFEVKELLELQQTENRVTPPIPVKELSNRDPEGTWPQGEFSGVVEAADLPYRRWRNPTPEKRPVVGEKPDHLITFPMVAKNPELLDAFVLQMSDYELCRCSSGAKTGWGFGESGYAGVLFTGGELEKYQIPEKYYFSDGNNGLNMNAANIGFPVSNVMCATFNEDLSYREGVAIAEEAKSMELSCILAPAANLHRNPLCGRHSEYFSEDPLLSGRMAGQEGRGLQDQGISCSLKHFFANNTEFLRNTNHAIMTERTARELYLRVFEEAFTVYMPDTIMTGYNAANGVWCAEDEELLEGILRNEWGFTGYVMTDWGGGNSCHGGAPAQAGLSWIAPGSMDDSTVTPILETLEAGRLDRQRLQANVRDMLRILIKYAQ